MTSCLTGLDWTKQLNSTWAKHLNPNKWNMKSAVQWYYPFDDGIIWVNWQPWTKITYNWCFLENKKLPNIFVYFSKDLCPQDLSKIAQSDEMVNLRCPPVGQRRNRDRSGRKSSVTSGDDERWWWRRYRPEMGSTPTSQRRHAQVDFAHCDAVQK